MNYKLSIFLTFLLSFVMKGNTADLKPNHVEERTYYSSYEVLENALLEIDNKYGNVNITTWNQNKVEIKATVTFSHWNEKTAKEKIKCVKIKTSGTKSYVKAVTEFVCDVSIKENNNRFRNHNRNHNFGVKIHYEVKIPNYGNLSIYNKYGNVILGTIGGNTRIDLKYGTLIANTLKSISNILDLSYSKGTLIQLVNNLTVKDANYSDIMINKAKVVQFNADYTDIKIDQAEQILSSNMDYGRLEIGETNCLTFSADYSHLKIDLLHDCLNLDISYGTYEINQTNDQFSKIDIDAGYSNGKIKINPNASFKAHTVNKYSGTSLSSDIHVKKRDKSHTHEEIHAEYNPSGCLCSTLYINSQYGHIELNVLK